MIRIHPEQLSVQLKQSLYQCYFLLGNDPLLLQESQNIIRNQAKIQGFNEILNLKINMSTDWDSIFTFCQSLNIFSSRQILLLILPDNNISRTIENCLLQLASLLHKDLLLILQSNKLTYAQEKSAWFQSIKRYTILVNCTTPEETQLPKWIDNRAKQMKLKLDDAVCHLLCYCYEGNLLALVQVLEQLSIMYPNENLILPQLENVVYDATYFTLFQWIDAVLAGKKKRSIHILQQLKKEAFEPMALLYSIQREVLLLLTLKRQMTNIPIQDLFNQYKVWQHRRLLVIQALKRLTLNQLRDIISLTSKIELTIKKHYNYCPWLDFNALILLLCGDVLPRVIINHD
ncbi:DNA polymerase III subunit delta [Candidatus Curculioniphilus buchneri]|uniref:DNA polymerase III subunit delta n=1 Tax=Candidatus Curculioniphilus buchneri TaxID=690594 RepID=UPI00376F3306